jgi:hypothetical protein
MRPKLLRGLVRKSESSSHLSDRFAEIDPFFVRAPFECLRKGGERGLLFQHFGELTSRVKKARANGEDRRGDNLRNLGGGEPFELVKQKHGALFLGEFVDDAAERTHALEARNVFIGRKARIDVRFVDLRCHELRATLRRAPVHEHDIDRHAVQPRRELGLSAEVFQAAMNLEEDLLNDVFEIGARSDHAKHESRDFGTMSKEELSKSLAIPSLAARDHFIWFEHSVEANPEPFWVRQ